MFESSSPSIRRTAAARQFERARRRSFNVEPDRLETRFGGERGAGAVEEREGGSPAPQARVEAKARAWKEEESQTEGR